MNLTTRHFGKARLDYGAGAGHRSEPLALVKLLSLMELTVGIPEIAIGLVDGPVAVEHPALNAASLKQVSVTSGCADTASFACTHGTFVAGILIGKRGSEAPAICPKCRLLVRPIFAEKASYAQQIPSATPGELARAIFEVMNAGARIVNLSLALVESSSREAQELVQVLDLAARRRVIVIAAAGNQGALDSSLITRHPWVIPVAAYDLWKNPAPTTNLGNTIGRRGVGAPGEGVTSLRAASGSLTLGGSSVAAPFVSGTAALLWSCFPRAGAVEIKLAIQGTSPRRTITPPLLNAEMAYALMMRQ